MSGTEHIVSFGATDTIDLRNKSTTLTFLKQHASFIHSKSYPYNHRYVSLSVFYCLKVKL